MGTALFMLSLALCLVILLRPGWALTLISVLTGNSEVLHEAGDLCPEKGKSKNPYWIGPTSYPDPPSPK